MNLSMDPKAYDSPLGSRYASKEMGALFSPFSRALVWRKLWLALAEGEQELGLPITDAQIQELADHLEEIDFALIEQYEKETQHDVMAHIHAYGDLCPNARKIIHLGATSCFVTDNGDLILFREGLQILAYKLERVIHALTAFAKTHAKLPCVAFTHFQAAQLTTVGKRAATWLQDFIDDMQELKMRLEQLRFLGVKGATGTQASYMALFEGDSAKVEELDRRVAKKMGFFNLYTVTGQTYPRKQDMQVLTALAGIGVSASKFATDLRLLSHLKELSEPFQDKQVGSSAMPYKRNPVLSERICSLSRFLINLSANGAQTAAAQWLERSLDDSANRRLTMPEAFLTCDAILDLLLKVIQGLKVNIPVIEQHVQEELPFMATENILMAAVKKGGDRQKLHEELRQLSLSGKGDTLLSRIAQNPSFGLSENDLKQIVSVEAFIGRAPEQVEELIQRGLS